MSKRSFITRCLRLPVLVWNRLIGPALPGCCRFYPSCSAYGLEALDRHPWPRALALIVWRVVRCNPFHPGGYDPVPEPKGAQRGPAARARQGDRGNPHPHGK